MIRQPAALCLMGPTASGKTALALELCRHYPCEIISVDSALVYRGMDIGTAKPSAAELAQVPHHLIDIRDPVAAYSAAEFRVDALRLLNAISARGHIPLLVGGTMLYFNVLREGIAALPAAEPALRAELAARAAAEGWPALHRELAQVDPQAAARIHPNHSQRIQRALEVYRLTGVPLSELQAQEERTLLSHRLVTFVLAPAERAVLHERIDVRFRQMLAQGLIEEVEHLRARGDLHAELPSMRAVGYRQVWEYLEGGTDYAGLVERGVAATRQLAKRQFTWLRRWPDAAWLLTDAAQRIAHTPTLPEGIVPGMEVLDAALKYLQRVSI